MFASLALRYGARAGFQLNERRQTTLEALGASYFKNLRPFAGPAILLFLRRRFTGQQSLRLLKTGRASKAGCWGIRPPQAVKACLARAQRAVGESSGNQGQSLSTEVLCRKRSALDQEATIKPLGQNRGCTPVLVHTALPARSPLRQPIRCSRRLAGEVQANRPQHPV